MFRYFLIIVSLVLGGCLGPAVECSDESCEDPMQNAWSCTNTIQPGQKGQQVTLQTDIFPEPGNYTAQFNITDPNLGLPGGTQILLRAEVTWYVNGNSVRRVIDVADGISITGTAEKVNIRVYDDSTIVGPLANVKTVGVSITVARGTRANIEQPPTYYLANWTIDPGNQAMVDIPDNIGAASVFVTVGPIVIGTAIGAYDVMVNQEASTRFKYYDPRQTDWVPLAPGVTRIRVEVSAAAPAVNVVVVLGIDG